MKKEPMARTLDPYAGTDLEKFEALVNQFEHVSTTSIPAPQMRRIIRENLVELRRIQKQLRDIWECLHCAGLRMNAEETLAGGVRNMAQAYVSAKEIINKS